MTTPMKMRRRGCGPEVLFSEAAVQQLGRVGRPTACPGRVGEWAVQLPIWWAHRGRAAAFWLQPWVRGNGPGPCRGPDFEAQGESIDFGEQKDSDQRPNQEKPN